MQIYKAGDDQGISGITYRDVAERLWKLVEDACTFSIFAYQIGIFVNGKGGFVFAETDISL